MGGEPLRRLADANRPDLISDRHEIAQASAHVELERRRARPQVSIVPGLTYQDQRHITGFRNGSLFDIGITPAMGLRRGVTRRTAATPVTGAASEYQGAAGHGHSCVGD